MKKKVDKLYCTYFGVNDIIFAYLPCKLPAVQEPFDLCPETISIRQRVLCKKKKQKLCGIFLTKTNLVTVEEKFISCFKVVCKWLAFCSAQVNDHRIKYPLLSTLSMWPSNLLPVFSVCFCNFLCTHNTHIARMKCESTEIVLLCFVLLFYEFAYYMYR